MLEHYGGCIEKFSKVLYKCQRTTRLSEQRKMSQPIIANYFSKKYKPVKSYPDTRIICLRAWIEPWMTTIFLLRFHCCIIPKSNFQASCELLLQKYWMYLYLWNNYSSRIALCWLTNSRYWRFSSYIQLVIKRTLIHKGDTYSLNTLLVYNVVNFSFPHSTSRRWSCFHLLITKEWLYQRQQFFKLKTPFWS